MGIDLKHFVNQKHVAWNSKIIAYNKNYSKNRPYLWSQNGLYFPKYYTWRLAFSITINP